jgi:putative pyruvate formate lyase activating enzyme
MKTLRIQRDNRHTFFSDEIARGSLARYFAVVRNERAAKFLLARKLEANFERDEPLEQLLKTHAFSTEEFHRFEKEQDDIPLKSQKIQTPKESYFDLKAEIAHKILNSCSLCTHNCHVDRLNGKRGYCGCGTELAVSSIFAHMGEEPELVPSGTIFTMGCTMRCKHCQNWTISQWIENSQIYEPQSMAEEIDALRRNGCRNANLVGGEPTPWFLQWLETFKHVNVNIPVVWNSNTYYDQQTAQLLAGFADVYLLDFKYGSSDCSERISDAPDYWAVCTRNHLEAAKHGELIVRVLVLPGHLECCTKQILLWIAENIGKETRVNVMFQYRPEWRAAEFPELRRGLSKREMNRAIILAKEAGLTNSTA